MKKFFGMALLASGLSFGAAAFADNHEKHETAACKDHCEKCTHGKEKAEACSNKECDCAKHGHKHDHKTEGKKEDKK